MIGPGAPAPDFELPDQDGKPVRLADFRGRTIVLGLTEDAADGTKGRYAFVYGDFRRVHRTGSSPAPTVPPSGATTRPSSSPPTTCWRTWMRRAA